MGISPTQLIIVLVIVVLIFGTKKMRNLGGDLGGAVKGFKSAVNKESTKVEHITQSRKEEMSAADNQSNTAS